MMADLGWVGGVPPALVMACTFTLRSVVTGWTSTLGRMTVMVMLRVPCWKDMTRSEGLGAGSAFGGAL